ncbi:MAG: ATP-binding protein [Oscillospiraceae bacterium]|nr:ATP-binding protein [Oscillospiraceae bacterium]
MKKRLFLYTTLIIFAGLLSFFTASIYVTYTNNLSLAKDTVMETAKIYSDLYTPDTNLASFVKAGDNTRITVVALDGTVLADSGVPDLSTLENHLNRPEIQAAANGSPAAYVRHSATLGVDLIYYALKVNIAADGGGNNYIFIRAAIPVAKIDSYLFRSLPLLIFLLLILALLCFLFIRGTVNRIIAKFNSVEQNLRLLSDNSNGEYKSDLNHIGKGYEEIDKITREIGDVALVLQKNFNDLHNEKNKLDYIINNIGDGLFVLDENKSVVLINTAALDIFGVTPDIISKNLNYLCYDKTLSEAVEDCVSSAKSALFELTLNGNIYLITVKRLPDTVLTTIVLSNVTENRENAKRREEFFANASHELKTPLTAIKGFTELTALNNKDESINKYIDSITRETDRMLSLIGDMLKLSELENSTNTKNINSVSVSLAKVVDEVRETESTAINEKSIIFKTSGDCTVQADPGHVYELVKNLVENAVRYNNQGGSVTITIKSHNNSGSLTVSDNGIGISPEEQTRIFERFYRVEKSRSQRNGGTGLGLSIVKHICALYDWKLSLKSKLGVGTEITVFFNCL